MTDKSAARICATRCPLPMPQDGNVHAMPCRIDFDGNAPVKSYFHVQHDSESNTYRAQFRGVELRGTSMSLSSLGMTGLVVEDAGSIDEGGRMWEIEEHFDQFLSWHVPADPSSATSTHALPTALPQWLDVSQALLE